jgi:peroxiredoxin
MPVLLKLSIKVLAALALLYCGAIVALFFSMRASNAVAGKALALLPEPAFMVLPLETMWCEARKGKLSVGQEAPDFDLATLDKTARVRLSSLRNAEPVVLVFGSFTCPPFRKEVPAVNKVYEDYKDRARFYFVYIEEAHASDVWPLASNVRDKVVYATAGSYEERASVAQVCSKELKLRLPILVDDMNNGTDVAYSAWPTRIYIVDRDGKVAYKSRPGPFGFEAAELEKALVRLVPAASAAEPRPSGPAS